MIWSWNSRFRLATWAPGFLILVLRQHRFAQPMLSRREIAWRGCGFVSICSMRDVIEAWRAVVAVVLIVSAPNPETDSLNLIS